MGITQPVKQITLSENIKHCLSEVRMSEDHMDEFEHYNFDQDKHVNMSGHSGKHRSKREAELNTNRPNPGGHERKILTKLMNAEKNNQAAAAASGAHREKSSN